MEKEPYLSIVIAARNDNYGGDFNQRLYTALSWNTGLLEKYQINTEIILVNWNPIPDRPATLSQYSVPEERKHVYYRVIDVPHKHHKKYSNPVVRKNFPLYEFIAKNVGIQRAKGSFVLCTNADVLFSEILIGNIAKQSLEKDKVYRSLRCDFKFRSPIQKESDIQENVTAFFLESGVIQSTGKESFKKRLRKAQLRNRQKILFYKIYLPFRMFYKYYSSRLFLMKHLFNASGDFLLMHRTNWLKGNHYPEDTYIATHTDSLHLLRCLANNLDEVILDGYVYHQEHQRRFDFSEKNESMDLMFQRLLKSIHQYIVNNKPEEISQEWGINNNLKETIL